MKMRNTLSGITALLLVGTFYSFAFCMVEDIDDKPISMDFYYSTETDSNGAAQGEATSAFMPSAEAVTEQPQQETSFVTTIPELIDRIFEEKTTPASSEEIQVTEQPEPDEKAEVATAAKPVVYADEDPEDELLSKETQAVTNVPEDEDIEEETETVIEIEDAEIMEETPVDADYEEDEDVSEEETSYETTSSVMVTVTEDITTPAEPPVETTAVPDLIITLDDTTTTTSETTPAPSGNVSDITPSSADSVFTVKYGGANHTEDAFTLICQIVNNEISPYFSDEAIKAQAVAAYSYVKYHNDNGLIPSVLVKPNPSQRIVDMVSAVWGKCCYYNGKVAQTVYMASSSGYTASSKNVWGGHFDYLVSVPCPFDAESDPNYGTVKKFSEDSIRKALESYFGITLSGDPNNWIKIVSYIDGNYISKIDIDGQASTTGRKMRESILGYQINSASFDVSYADGVFTFTTYGWGHGVGMSQNGANILAKMGYSYEEILKYYYTGIDVL